MPSRNDYRSIPLNNFPPPSNNEPLTLERRRPTPPRKSDIHDYDPPYLKILILAFLVFFLCGCVALGFTRFIVYFWSDRFGITESSTTKIVVSTPLPTTEIVVPTSPPTTPPLIIETSPSTTRSNLLREQIRPERPTTPRPTTTTEAGTTPTLPPTTPRPTTTTEASTTTTVPTTLRPTTVPTTLRPTTVPTTLRPTTKATAPTIPNPSASPCQHGEFIADAFDCTIFYRCNWGDKRRFTCRAGTVFNPRISVCDWPSAVPSCSSFG